MAAVDRAEARCREIGNILANALELAGQTVADALLAGDDATAAAGLAPGRDALTAERDTLRRAIAELQERERGLRREITTTADEAQRQIEAALSPLSEALRRSAQEAARQIVSIFADAAALADTAPSMVRVKLPTRQAVEGLAGMDRLLDYRRTVPVSSGVIDLQHAIRKAAPAVRLGPVRVQSAMP